MHLSDIALDGNESSFSLLSLLLSFLSSPYLLPHFHSLPDRSPVHFISTIRSLEKRWDVDLGTFRF